MPFCPIKQYITTRQQTGKLDGVNKQVEKHLCRNWFKSRHLQKVILPVLLLLAVMSTGDICTAPAFAEASSDKQENQPVATQRGEQDLHQPIRVRIFTLRDITAEQAKDYLQSAQIADTVLAIPGTTAISVTGSPEQLVQASTVIKLVDANEKFDVQFLDITPNKTLPTAEKIEEQLGREYSVGSLMEGPASGAAIKAIACLYKDKLLIITPQEQTNKITETVQSLLIEKQPEAEPNQQSLQQTPQTEPNTQPQQAIASANDVVSTGSPQVVFAKEPLVVEPNSPRGEATGKTQAAAPAGVTTEPNRPKTEDDMLGDFLTELEETAKTEKAEREAQKVKTEPNQLGQIAAEPNVQQPKIAEQQPAKQIEQTKAVADFGELSRVEKIQKQPSAESQPVVSQAEQAQEELPEEANVSFLREESQGQQPVDFGELSRAAEAKEPAVPLLDIPNGEEMLELNLPEKLEIVALIDLVGKYLNLNYLYDETKVTGSVTIKVQGKLRVRELYDLLESVLKFRGFIMSRKGKLVTIVPAAEVLEQDPTFAAGIKPGDVVVTKIFHLQYITTAAAKNLLNGMRLGTNTMEIPESGTLVITEYAFRMQRIEDLLAIVDVSGPPKEFKLRILNYTLAEALVPKIQALAEQLGTVNITVGTTTPSPMPAPTPRGRPRQPAQPQQAATTESAKKTAVYIDFDKRTNRILMIGLANEIAAVEQIIDSLDVPLQDLRIVREYEIQYVDVDKIVEAMKEFGIVESAGTPSAPTARPAVAAPAPQPAAAIISLDQPQVVKLETTNSLLVNATPEQHIQISRIISYIDREPVEAAIPYRIYRLENQEPEALAEVLNNLIEKTVKDKEGKIQQTIKYTEENIAIVPDKNTFSLIVYASKKNQEWIGNLIKSLDRRRPQVLIEVSLVDITRDDEFNYDLNIVANAKNLVTGNLAVAGSQLITTASGSNLEGGFNLTDTTGTNLGAVKGFYSNDRIQALLTLIDKKSYGRVLAKPKVLVNDNEQGDIVTTERTYVSSQTQSYPGTTTGTTPIPVTTQTWAPYEAKIELKITPQISEGDLLRLEIMMTREDFENLAAAKKAGSPPDYATSNVNTTVTVPDGSTIILGGLTKLNQTKAGNKVPLLGDIPVAGALFRSTAKSDTGSKLYIFVKANILRPEQTVGLKQLEKISRTNRIEFEKAEKEFQQHQYFPGIKPEPIPPEKVLEQEVEESNEPEMLTSASSVEPSRK
jgi:general secretion pathway protein D